MFVLRCTQKLLRRIKQAPADATPPSTSALGDWYANVVIVDRKPLVQCCSARTLLPVLLPARDIAGLVPRLRTALAEILRALEVPAPAIDAELAAMADVVVGKTASRVVLGVMNDHRRMIDLGAGRDLLQASLDLARAPMLLTTSPDGVWPTMATQAALQPPPHD